MGWWSFIVGVEKESCSCGINCGSNWGLLPLLELTTPSHGLIPNFHLKQPQQLFKSPLETFNPLMFLLPHFPLII